MSWNFQQNKYHTLIYIKYDNLSFESFSFTILKYNFGSLVSSVKLIRISLTRSLDLLHICVSLQMIWSKMTHMPRIVEKTSCLNTVIGY